MKLAVRASLLAAHLLLASAHAAVVGHRASLIVHDVLDDSLGGHATRAETWLLSGLGRKPRSTPGDVCPSVVVSGLMIGCFCTALILSWWQRRVRSELLVGPDTHRTEATITNLQHLTSGDKNETHHYLASYTFEAVRLDGMRCRMKVEPRRQIDMIGTREQPLIAWKDMRKGSKVQVIYLKSDPRYCRLDKALEDDYEDTHNMCHVGCVGFCTLCFVACMIVFEIAIVKCFMRKWENGHLVGSLIFGGSIACVVIFCCPSILPGRSPMDVTEEALGYQKKAESLGDISGFWLFQSALGNFEYKFVMATETTVTTCGRPQGSNDWEKECEGHFVGEEGKELIWDDDQGSHVRVLFDDDMGGGPHMRLAGSIATDAGEVVRFEGARPATA